MEERYFPSSDHPAPASADHPSATPGGPAAPSEIDVSPAGDNQLTKALFGYLLFGAVGVLVLLVLYFGLGYNIWKSSALAIIAGFVGLGLARWTIGALIIIGVQIAVYGGVAALIGWLKPTEPLAVLALLGVGVAVTTVIFCEVLERGHWLSRLLHLPITPNKRPLARSLIFAIAGPLALFVYTEQVSKPRMQAAKTGSEIGAHAPDSTREVVETVVFVVVLVLMLKSFVAEAFVIPTGSMAETLLGYNKDVTCPACGTQFPVSCSKEVEPPEGHQAIAVTDCVCPNCRKYIRLVKGPARKDDEVVDPGPTTGDRVLVAKFLYDLFKRAPERLDVVVFKYPGDSRFRSKEKERTDRDLERDKFPYNGPYSRSYVPMNYIKRLIGLPGETIAICGGKLYSLPADKGPKYPDNSTVDPSKLWYHEYMYIDYPAALELFKNKKFDIVRKSPENVLAMKRLVYDNDHPAKDLEGPKWQRWAGDGWSRDSANGFQSAGGDKLQWLHYRHVLRDTGGERQLITDFLGYNSAEGTQPKNWVGDLVVECEANIAKPQGELVLELCRGVDRFQAQWGLADGTCTLYRITDGDKTPRKLDSKPTGLGKGTHCLRLANVDQRLLVWIDDKLVWPDGFAYDAPATQGPTKNDLEPASIGVKGAPVEVKHLKLFRDVYYTTRTKSDPTISDLANPDAWDALRDPPVQTIYVQPDHFLCLGDNSPMSSDSRDWGVVPRRLMLGRALMVYYPFYFPFWPLQSQENRLGLIH